MNTMLEAISTLNPILLSLLAGTFTWLVTAMGSAGVFFFTSINRRILDAALGFTAGVMIAASFWSLLAPSIALAKTLGVTPWMPPLIGFLLGGFFLWALDKVLPHVHIHEPRANAEGVKTTWRKTVLLFLAITLHNIPEGLAIGVAFGAASIGIPGATLSGALALAIGIGIQNFPEGFAVSMPFRREGVSKTKSFLYGQAS